MALASYISGPYRPFQKAGPKTTFEVKVTNAGFFAWVDMPGVGEHDEVRIRMAPGMLTFRGEARAEQMLMRYPRPRSYEGGFKLPFNTDYTLQIAILMKNGVIRFFIPAVLTNNIVVPRSYFVILPLPLPSAEENRDKNPFQMVGLKSTFEQVAVSQDTMFFRADLPGVERVHWKNLHIPDQTWLDFECVAPRRWGIEDPLERKYAGRIRLNCRCCFVMDVDSMVFNGVLTVYVFKRKKQLRPIVKYEFASH